MISLENYLTRCGYAKSKHFIYEKRLREFTDMFPGRTVYRSADIEAYRLRVRAKASKCHIRVVERFLRLNLKLTDHDRYRTGAPPLTFREAYCLYLRHLQQRECAQSTLRQYSRHFDRCAGFLEISGITTVSEVDQQVVQAYKHHVFMSRTKDGESYAISSQKGILLAVKNLFAWLCREGYLARNPAKRLRFPREEQKLSRNYFTQKELAAILHVIDTDSVYGFYDRTLFEFLYSTGMRLGEVLNVRIADVRLADGLVTVVEGKGKKDRVCVLTRIAQRYLEIYLARVRGRFLAPGAISDRLFPSACGNALDMKYPARRIRRYARLAGVTHDFSAHAFRRSFATHLLEEGVDVRYIQQLLGHEKINTTMRYIKVTTGDLRSVLVRYHPWERKMGAEEVIFKGEARYPHAPGNGKTGVLQGARGE